jgi:hypothetical protein
LKTKLSFHYLIFILFFGVNSCQNKIDNDKNRDNPINISTSKDSNNKKYVLEDLKIRILTKSEIPNDVFYEGEIKTAVRWKDKLGDNIVLTTETGNYRSDKFEHDNDGDDAELFAYHFTRYEGRSNLVWKVYDYISDCPVDLDVKFIDKTLNITDLNKNQIAEIWIMYTTVCHGDISPADMKIIMYEGKSKHAMRGRNRISLGPSEDGDTYIEGGEYIFDDAFLNSPKEFQDFAKNLWNANIEYK